MLAVTRQTDFAQRCRDALLGAAYRLHLIDEDPADAFHSVSRCFESTHFTRQRNAQVGQVFTSRYHQPPSLITADNPRTLDFLVSIRSTHRII